VVINTEKTEGESRHVPRITQNIPYLHNKRDYLMRLRKAIVGLADKGNGGQPACPEKWKRCKKKIINS
jgi:hypothetical protein